MRLKKRLTMLVLAATLACASLAIPAAAKNVSAAETTLLKTKKKNGWDSGKKHYYKNGKAVTGVVKIGKKLYAFDEKGLRLKKTQIFAWKSKYYKVASNGVATRWTGVQHHAAKVLELFCKADNVTNRLVKAFEWSRDLPYKVVSAPAAGVNAAEYYGKIGLMQRTGDCTVQAYTFYWLANVLGYSVKEIDGYAYNSKNTENPYSEHSWVELYRGKKAYVCDPNFSKQYGDKVASTRAGLPLGFRVLYGTKSTLMYCRADKTRIPLYGRA